MYPVATNFHRLVLQDAPQTRIRIYFIGDGVDCTNDLDVQTNGTLLVNAAGDTDSNKRIGQNGVVFNELFNPDKNIQIGTAVSSQVGMTLLNYDGALDGFTYGRCKIYLDVYDSANSAWLPCPMGVYIIKAPSKRKMKLISLTGFDQMQKLDEIADSWWAGLNWSGGITLSQLITSLATQVGVSVSTNTASAILNGSLSYTEAPFDCVEATYRELLEMIAEATGTIARFDRNGALDLRWFDWAVIPPDSSTWIVDTTMVGNNCLSIDLAEYKVKPIDLLKVNISENTFGASVGSGTNAYTILNNLFLNGANASAIVAKATPIYNRLNAIATDLETGYYPVKSKVIMDWSIEAGDCIGFNVFEDGDYRIRYAMIFQQQMTWRGGFVTSEILCDGNETRPMNDASERSNYRADYKLNHMTIEADRIDLLGYTTINNGFKVNLDGTFEANGATINGELESNGTVNSTPVTVDISNGVITLYQNGSAIGTLGYKEYTSGSYDTVLDLSKSDGSRIIIHGDSISALSKISGSNFLRLMFNGSGFSVGKASGGNVSVIVDANDSGVDVARDVSVLGNVSVSNNVSAADFLVNGSSIAIKSYVDTTSANYTINSNHYCAVNYPTGINPANCIGIGMYVWTSVTGAVSVMPYGQNASGTQWYLIGDAGATINGVRFRYWYI